MTTIFSAVRRDTILQLDRKNYKELIREIDKRGTPFRVSTRYFCSKNSVTVEKRLLIMEDPTCQKQM